MLSVIAIVVALAISTWAYQVVQATITFNFTDATQRAAVLLDYAKAKGLDVYTDSTRTTVDATKVLPAVQASIKQDFKDVVVGYRSKNAGDSAQQTSITSEKATINP